MYLVDANLLIYATYSGSDHHKAAREWLDNQLSSHPQSVGLPWPSLLAFLRVITNPRVYREALPIDVAWQSVEDWISRQAAWIPVPTVRHQRLLAEILDSTRPAGNFVMDAHLAALAVEHGLIVATADRGFARFSGVRWVNPLAG